MVELISNQESQPLHRLADSGLVDCEVDRFTSDFHWNSFYLQGNSFIPGYDKYTSLRSGDAVDNVS